tara:strand:- start:224 stop:445 length:222 start_codon:yes stop_codon:yes gene_type:complete
VLSNGADPLLFPNMPLVKSENYVATFIADTIDPIQKAIKADNKANNIQVENFVAVGSLASSQRESSTGPPRRK